MYTYVSKKSFSPRYVVGKNINDFIVTSDISVQFYLEFFNDMSNFDDLRCYLICNNTINIK